MVETYIKIDDIIFAVSRVAKKNVIKQIYLKILLIEKKQRKHVLYIIISKNLFKLKIYVKVILKLIFHRDNFRVKHSRFYFITWLWDLHSVQTTEGFLMIYC